MAQTIPLNNLYETYFLDYASYVILERAVPTLEDGFKPVQRRILHSMREMHDGRYHKVANIIGNSMQFHPHGDASIGDAIVNLGQKELLIDTQGNWGDIRTGDSAAASRYIEARLTPFALEVLYSPKITKWQYSYDGRKKEPVTLPVKFPMVLAQGVEGIAVGLSTKILPHNFNELIDASINYLKGKQFELYPDFPTYGIVDVSQYNKGERGGRIRIRATIEEFDSNTLVIKDVPYGTTTTSIIESIVKANDQGKIKVKKVSDNTAEHVEIFVYLPPNTSKSILINALYAFTDCETSISPNACVIYEDRPVFLSVDEILKISTDRTMEMLRQELEIKKKELKEAILFSSLEKIFIDNRIYRDFDNKGESFEEVLQIIDRGLEPHKELFYREITRDDLLRLTEIRIKRISRYDSSKAEEQLKKYEEDLAQTEYHLAHLREFTIAFFAELKKKYGTGKERKTRIATFDQIEASEVAANNVKLYIDREGGFIGTSLKRDELLFECSDLDDIVVFKDNGTFMVTKVGEKTFVGKNILHANVWKKNDERMVYHMAYLDAKSGTSFVKRFQISSITRDREYDLTTGERGNKVWYFSANPNGEAEIVQVKLNQSSKARKKIFEFDFATIDIKGRNSKGNILTKYPIRSVKLLERGGSTLGGLDVYWDLDTGRINSDERGEYIGNFVGEDAFIVFYIQGEYEIVTYRNMLRFDPHAVRYLGKFDQEAVYTLIYRDGETKTDFIKRFKIETTTLEKRFPIINVHRSSQIHFVGRGIENRVEVIYKDGRKKEKAKFRPSDLMDVKGWRAQGNKFPVQQIEKVELQQPDNEDLNQQAQLF